MGYGDVAFEILPKADRARRRGQAPAWKRALFEMLDVGHATKLYDPDVAAQGLMAWTLLELIAAAFLREVQSIEHEGFSRSYHPVQANGSTFRGRLLVAEDIRANLVRRDRFFVEYATYDRDITVNQVLRETLRVLEGANLSGGLHARVLACGVPLADVSPLRIGPSFFDRLVLGRSTARYGKALALARMILELRAPSLEQGASDVFAILFDMNLLWEAYLSALFRQVCPPELEIQTQKSRLFWSVRGGPRAVVRPDILVLDRKSKAVVMIADAKWKVFDARGPKDGDLKQMFVYNELFACRTAVLVCPAAPGSTGGFEGTFSGKDHSCAVAGVELLRDGRMSSAAVRGQVADLIRNVRR
jgi:5-methylcytosine-specific restriction enzyme subunit McrC